MQLLTWVLLPCTYSFLIVQVKSYLLICLTCCSVSVSTLLQGWTTCQRKDLSTETWLLGTFWSLETKRARYHSHNLYVWFQMTSGRLTTPLYYKHYKCIAVGFCRHIIVTWFAVRVFPQDPLSVL